MMASFAKTDVTVDVWRVLHHRRDIPSTIAEELDHERRDDER